MKDGPASLRCLFMTMADLPRTRETLVTRPTLLKGLVDAADHHSWEEFYRRYRGAVHGLARKSGLGEQDAEEVVQDVFRRVSETIQDFEHDPARGTFKSWLFNLTRWRIADKFRQRRPQAEAMNRADGDTRTATVERVPDADEMDGKIEAEWRHSLLDQAMQQLKTEVDPLHFQAFYLLNQGHDGRTVSETLGMPRVTVSVVNHRLTQRLKREVKRLQAELG
jgi:RNA polymerase sigma factor (sigma-70 family)